MEGSAKQIKRGVIMSYLSISINIVTGLLYTPWMIHSIGRANFGLYTLAMSVISLFVFDFGLSSAVTRFISKALAERDQEAANRCLGMVYRLYIYIDIALILLLSIVFIFIPQIYKELTPDEISSFKVVFVIVAVFSVISFPFIPLNGVLIAHEKFVQLRICDIFHKLFIVVTMTICLILGYGLYALVIVNVVSGLLTIILKLVVIKVYTPQKVDYNSVKREEIHSIVSYSGWVTVKSVAQRCIFNLAPSILGALSGSVEIAILGIAITLEGYTYTFANAINGMFLPRVSRIVIQNSAEVLPLMIRVGRIQLIIISFLIFSVICFGHHFVFLWVGEQFSKSFICAVLIIIPSLFHLPQEIGFQTILAMNKVKMQAIVYAVMALTNIILAALLAPRYGSLGICISICIAYLIRTIGVDIFLYKRLNINLFSFFKQSYVSLFFPLLFSFLGGILINYFVQGQEWFSLILKAILFVFYYASIMYLFGMNQYEKNLAMDILKLKL